jgi:hypothetical protein
LYGVKSSYKDRESLYKDWVSFNEDRESSYKDRESLYKDWVSFNEDWVSSYNVRESSLKDWESLYEDWESSYGNWASFGGKSGIFRLYADTTGEASNGHFGFINSNNLSI